MVSVPGSWPLHGFFRRFLFRWRLHHRQVHFESCAVADFAVYPDVSAALLHDSVHGREAQAGAAALRFGGEKWLEDARLSGGVHADAGVADGEHHVGARVNDGVLRGVIAIELHVGSFDGQAAAVGHGVARVDYEVQGDLLDLAGVGFHAAEIGAGQKREFDIGADDARNHLNHSGDDFVQIQNARLQHLHAAEGEQLASEGGGTLGGLLNLFDVLARGILAIGGGGRQAVEKHFGVALHHH